GDVVLGNIGAGSRLAFTTIGSAVNEVARLEEMTKTLDTPILMSGEFKAILDEGRAGRLNSHGFRKLRGIGAPLDIYSLGD
ncbi:MAG: adenylate/guanylate cyclase domain-containing protein, partial [Alphaproteobacteria bacterium]